MENESNFVLVRLNDGNSAKIPCKAIAEKRIEHYREIDGADFDDEADVALSYETAELEDWLYNNTDLADFDGQYTIVKKEFLDTLNWDFDGDDSDAFKITDK